MAEFKMSDFKMAAMCELSKVILTLSLCPFCVLLGKCRVLTDGVMAFQGTFCEAGTFHFLYIKLRTQSSRSSVI